MHVDSPKSSRGRVAPAPEPAPARSGTSGRTCAAWGHGRELPPSGRRSGKAPASTPSTAAEGAPQPSPPRRPSRPRRTGGRPSMSTSRCPRDSPGGSSSPGRGPPVLNETIDGRVVLAPDVDGDERYELA